MPAKRKSPKRKSASPKRKGTKRRASRSPRRSPAKRARYSTKSRSPRRTSPKSGGGGKNTPILDANRCNIGELQPGPTGLVYQAVRSNVTGKKRWARCSMSPKGIGKHADSCAKQYGKAKVFC